jgi:GAF domain-containing protein
VCLSLIDAHGVTMDASAGFAQSIAAAARTINHRRSLDDTLQTIVEVARNSVPGFDQVGIATWQRKGKVETRAFTGDLVLRLDHLQYRLHEGPCSAALQGTETVSVSSLGDEQRWPQYVPEARSMGVRSQLAVRLHLDDGGTLGGINFYSTISDHVTEDAEALAQLFATHAAIALGHAQERASLNEAVQTRKVIGQAIGILMERYDISEDRAFAFLVRASSHNNIKLRAVAQHLVDHRTNKPLPVAGTLKPRTARTVDSSVGEANGSQFEPETTLPVQARDFVERSSADTT